MAHCDFVGATSAEKKQHVIEDADETIYSIFFDCNKINLLCHGYLRKMFDYPNDVAKILSKMVLLQWEWSYHNEYNSADTVSSENASFGICKAPHGGSNKNTIFESTFSNDRVDKPVVCQCIINIPMRPNTGIYKIEIFFNNYRNKTQYRFDSFGITSNEKISKLLASQLECKWDDLYFCQKEFVGWGLIKSNICGENENGLIYGCDNGCTNVDKTSNILYQNGIKYVSNNQYHRKFLPDIMQGDTIILSYDSNKNRLYFAKENDMTLDSYIENLPNNLTFYWCLGIATIFPFTISILDTKLFQLSLHK